jgi:hypothetical protein
MDEFPSIRASNQSLYDKTATNALNMHWEVGDWEESFLRERNTDANWEESKHSLELLVASRRVSLIPFAELHLAALGWLWLKKRWTGVHMSCIDSRSTQHQTQNRRPLSVPSKFKGHWKKMDQMDHNIMHGSCSSLPHSLPTFPFVSTSWLQTFGNKT